MPRARRVLLTLALAEFLAMALWFSASAVVPTLSDQWQLNRGATAWLTISVQLGFVAGALISALSSLADRFAAHKLMATCTILGAIANAAIPVFQLNYLPTLWCRFATGLCLAGIYPPAMKLVATWCQHNRGLWIGVLVGAISIGSALPHLFRGLPGADEGPWQGVLLTSSASALLGAVLVLALVRPGPLHLQASRFKLGSALSSLRQRATRLANIGYLGHMWELYSMWTWVPLMLLACYQQAGWSDNAARLAAFGVLAMGLPGCVLGGRFADRLGRTRITIWSLAVSGSCCVGVGFLFEHPLLLTLTCLLWGFAVVADSAQFSAAVTELSDPRFTGTTLTTQTCLGFLLTTITIQVLPSLVDQIGWRWAFSILAIGPVIGIWAMLSLRGLPEATKMAGGKR